MRPRADLSGATTALLAIPSAQPRSASVASTIPALARPVMNPAPPARPWLSPDQQQTDKKVL